MLGRRITVERHCTIGPASHRKSAFGDDRNLVTTAADQFAQSLAQDLLCDSSPIRERGVEEIDTPVERLSNEVPFALTQRPPSATQRVRAETERGHLEVSRAEAPSIHHRPEEGGGIEALAPMLITARSPRAQLGEQHGSNQHTALVDVGNPEGHARQLETVDAEPKNEQGYHQARYVEPARSNHGGTEKG